MKIVKGADGESGYECLAGHVHDSATAAVLCELGDKRATGAEVELRAGTVMLGHLIVQRVRELDDESARAMVAQALENLARLVEADVRAKAAEAFRRAR